MEKSRRVAVSPQHSVLVDADYLHMLDRAPQHDYVLRTLAKRTVGEQETPMMTAEMVIASWTTRKRFPMTMEYPLHFRKTYYPGRLHGNPQVEFECHTRASELTAVPPPLGYSRNSFRSCLLPGQPYNRLSPFGTDPEESNIAHARRLSLAEATGLWHLAEQIYQILHTLQENGMTHGDAELHNFIVTPSPLQLLPIDFEMAVRRELFEPEMWEKRCKRDWEQLARESVFLQCALGPQQGPLAKLGIDSIDALFKNSEPFHHAIDAGGEAHR